MELLKQIQEKNAPKADPSKGTYVEVKPADGK
jgi:hypothetical protein